MKHYTIRPLEWNTNGDASSIYTYYVRKRDDGRWIYGAEDSDNVTLRDFAGSAKSEAAAKRKCEAHNRKTLEKHLCVRDFSVLLDKLSECIAYHRYGYGGRYDYAEGMDTAKGMLEKFLGGKN